MFIFLQIQLFEPLINLGKCTPLKSIIKNLTNCKIMMLGFQKEVFSTLPKWLDFIFQTFSPQNV